MSTDKITTPRILVVDDSKLNRKVIIDTLSSFNYIIDEAGDGTAGLEMLRTKKYDLALIDTVMPYMDGKELIKKVKENSSIGFIPLILMTGNDDLDAKIEGLTIGADDFVHKPFDTRELIARVKSLIRLKITHDLLYKRNQQIKWELDAAERIQKFIIPEKFGKIGEIELSGKYLPKEQIGGDMYDFFRSEKEISFVIADATGHGIPAALMVTMAKMIFSTNALKYSSPKEILEKSNSDIMAIVSEGQYFTAFFAAYDPVKSILKFSNAGHTRPLLYRRKSGKVIFLDTDFGLFLGIDSSPEYQEKAVKIENGDRLILYTDGLSESKNEEGMEFSETVISRHLKELSNLSNDKFSEKLFESVSAFTGDRFKDDLSFIVIDFTPAQG